MAIYTCKIREPILGINTMAALAREMVGVHVSRQAVTHDCDLRHRCVD